MRDERVAANVFDDGDEPYHHALYEEYVRGFDEVPVLEDAVSIPPPRPRQPSFVRGERPSQRKEERPDGYSLREASLADLEQAYGEYLAPQPARAKSRPARAGKSAPRKRGRKAS
jgi:hypothetical protein